MDMAVRTGAWAKSGAPLPYLRRVAYLESHETEWIDTGILSYDDIVISAKMQSLNSSSRFMYGVRNQESTITFANKGQGPGFKRWGYSAFANALYETDVFTVKQDNTGVVINDKKEFYNERQIVTPSNGFTIVICAGRSSLNGVSSLSKQRTYFFRIFRNETIVRDFIPVLDISGRPCFYDQAQSVVPADDPSRFFYNQGSGEFTWGELDG